MRKYRKISQSSSMLQSAQSRDDGPMRGLSDHLSDHVHMRRRTYENVRASLDLALPL